MIDTLRVYLRVPKEAGIAIDADGNPDEAYISVGMELKEPVDEEAAVTLLEVMAGEAKEQMALWLGIEPEDLTLISEKEYTRNTEE